MLFGKKKRIAEYLSETKKGSAEYRDLLSSYVSGDLKAKLREIGLSGIEIHVDFDDRYQCVGIQGRYGRLFVDVQAENEEVAFGIDPIEPDCTEFYSWERVSASGGFLQLLKIRLEFYANGGAVSF